MGAVQTHSCVWRPQICISLFRRKERIEQPVLSDVLSPASKVWPLYALKNEGGPTNFLGVMFNYVN